MATRLPDPAEPVEIETIRLSAGTRLRVWALSDLHADSPANLERCVEGWPMATTYTTAINRARSRSILGRLGEAEKVGETWYDAAVNKLTGSKSGEDKDRAATGATSDDDERSMFTRARAAMQRARDEAAAAVAETRGDADADVDAVAEAVLVGPGFTEVLEETTAKDPHPAASESGADDTVDVLIMAGDAAAKVEVLREVFGAFRGKYDEVFFIHGNHEAWVGGGGHVEHSLAKLDLVEQVCEECGVRTRPALFQFDAAAGGGEPQRDVCVFPLLSWYHASFNTEPNLRDDDGAYAARSASFQRRWQDFRQCRWPASLVPDHATDFASLSTTSQALADHFAAMNEPALEALEAVLEGGGRYPNGRDDLEVMSFSHFVPTQALLPEKRFLMEPDLVSVVGSDPLRQQLERLRPNTHIYGHTHIPFDLVLGGTRYLQWPLGSVKEQARQCNEQARRGPLLIWEDGPMELAYTAWGEYYRLRPREPQKTSPLGPWVEDYHRILRARATRNTSVAR